jgi:hypothetical protein
VLALLPLLPLLATANPVDKRWTAQADVGSTTSDVFPPTGSESKPLIALNYPRADVL